jgi:phenolic acid decarboxylase
MTGVHLLGGCSVLMKHVLLSRLRWLLKSRGYKSPGTDQIAVELIQPGDKTVHSVVRKPVWAVERITICTCLNEGWQKMVVNNEAHHCYQQNLCKILSNILLARLTPCIEEHIGDCHCGSNFMLQEPDWLLVLPENQSPLIPSPVYWRIHLFLA